MKVQLVRRVPSVSPASQDPQDHLVNRVSCSGSGRRVRTEPWGNQDHKDWTGQMDVQEYQDRRVFWDRKETRGLWGPKGTWVHWETPAPED